MSRVHGAAGASAFPRVALVLSLAAACSDPVSHPGGHDAPADRAGPALVARPDLAPPTMAAGAAMPGVPAADAVAADAGAGASAGLLWHQTGTGNLGVWAWRNAAPGALAGDWTGYGISTGWTIVATADYDADGVDDWVVQQAGTSNFGVYLAPPSSGWTAFSASAGWAVADAADFDGDATPDLLWRGPADPAVGLGGIWLMAGTAPKPGGWRSLNVSAGWHPDGTGDFDADGKPDVVWHQAGTGNYGIWGMNGTTPAALPAAWHPFAVSAGWEVFDAVDMDASGTPDLLFRDAAGNTGIWRTTGWSLVPIGNGGWISVGGSAGWRVAAAVRGTAAGVANVAIDRVTLTQAVQRYDGSIPIVAGGNGVVVNVFATAARSLGAERPTIRVRLVRGGSVVAEDSRAATGALGTTVDASAPAHQVFFPASHLQAGVAVVAEIDPANARGETVRTDNVYPRGGTPMAVDLRAVPPLVVRFIPLQYAGGRTPTISDPAAYLRAAREMLPLGAVSSEVAAPLAIAAAGTPADAAWWEGALEEVQARRVAESGTSHYYGVALPAEGGSSAFGGYAYINTMFAGGWMSAVGVDASWAHWAPRMGTETVAHELGHNFGREHAPCGTAGAPDPAYPYAGGVTGVVGHDVHSVSAGLTTGIQQKPATWTDVMGYCESKWVSDYTYLGVLTFRGAPAAAALLAALDVEEARTDVLLVSGVAGAARAALKPVYAIRARPAMPDVAGPWRIEALDADGAPVLSYAFAPRAVDHGAAGPFAFALPADAATQRRIAVVRLVGPGGTAVRGAAAAAADRVASPDGDAVRQRRIDARSVELRWDAARWPGALVRDAATGEVLGFGAGGSATVRAGRGALEVLLSDGIHTETRRLPAAP